MNLATFLDAPSFLGQQPAPSPPPAPGASRTLTGQEAQAWEAYFRAIRAQTVGAWNRSRDAFLKYKKIREDLGLPVIATATEAGITGIDQQLYNQAAELGVMVGVSVSFIDDVLANKRRVAYRETEGLVIQALPGDTLRIELRGNRPVLVDVAGNPAAIAPGTTVEGIGMLSFGWAVAIAIVAIAAAAYFVLTAACDAWTQVTESKTAETISKHWSDQVEKKNATPEQAKAAIQAVFGGAAQVAGERARAAEARAAPATGLSKAVSTIAVVALGLGVLYVLAQVLATRRPALARS